MGIIGGREMRAALLLAVASAVVCFASAGDVEALAEAAAVSEEAAVYNDISHAADTVSLVQEKTHATKNFNIFGCCFHCKHNPSCTEKCMNKHKIENGSEGARQLEHDDLVHTARVVSLIQLAGDMADDESRRHTRSTSKDQVAIDAAKKLNKDSSKTRTFEMHSFFHCAFSCSHRVKCTKSCLKRHNIHMGVKAIMEEFASDKKGDETDVHTFDETL